MTMKYCSKTCKFMKIIKIYTAHKFTPNKNYNATQIHTSIKRPFEISKRKLEKISEKIKCGDVLEWAKVRVNMQYLPMLVTMYFYPTFRNKMQHFIIYLISLPVRFITNSFKFYYWKFKQKAITSPDSSFFSILSSKIH